MTKEKFKIICHAEDGRVVASLDMEGCLTIHHDHFTDDDEYDLIALINAFDRWNHRRQIHHSSKKGLNKKVVETLNKLQQEKPGEILFPDSV